MSGATLQAGNLMINACAVDTVKETFCKKRYIQLESKVFYGNMKYFKCYSLALKHDKNFSRLNQVKNVNEFES